MTYKPNEKYTVVWRYKRNATWTKPKKSKTGRGVQNTTEPVPKHMQGKFYERDVFGKDLPMVKEKITARLREKGDEEQILITEVYLSGSKGNPAVKKHSGESESSEE